MQQIVEYRVDLTEDCISFPEFPIDHIKREFYIRNLMNTFSSEQKVIMLEGSFSSGKSLLLAEFAKFNSNRCVSFFVGNDYWSSNISRFLNEMCHQMKRICNPRLKQKLESKDIDSLQEHELKQLFSRLYSDLLSQTRQNKGPFYLVIDGIDKIEERNGEDNLLKYIPEGDSSGVYILLSSIKGKKYSFNYTSISIPYFSESETEKFLDAYLNKNEFRNVYLACEGMPGYLREIKRQLVNGTEKYQVLQNLPHGINNLLEKSWRRVNNNNFELMEILTLLTYTKKSFSPKEISQILNISESFISDHVKLLDFIQIENGEYSIISPYKYFLCTKLDNNKVSVNQKLIEYYEKKPKNQESILYLPELYKQNNMYQALVDLVNVETILDTLRQTLQTSLVRRNLRVLADMAFESEDWQRLTWATLSEAVFTRIITNPSVIEVEIDALLAIGKHEKALKLAYDCILPEDRLLLLAKVCNYMQTEKIFIPDETIQALTESIDLIDGSLKINDEIINKLIDISVNLFPLKAELSLKLLKRIAEETGDVNQDSLMDFLLVRLLLRLDPSEESIEQIRGEIGNENMHDFSKAASTLIAENSVDKVLEQVDEISDVSAQIYYLQTWCNLNKESKEAYKIVDYALKIMINSTNYVPTHLHMRQIAEPLLYCEDIDLCKELVNNFDNLIATVIKNPLEEYARLALILATIQKKWSIEDSIDRFYEVYILLDEIKELDTKCMVLVQLITRCKEIVNDDIQMFNDLRNQLIMDFNKLLNTSADHFKITKRIIRALTLVDHKLAYTFALKVNAQQRRNSLSLEILKVYIQKVSGELDYKFIDEVLKSIEEKHFYDYVIVHILKSLSKKEENAIQESYMKYWSRIKNIENLINKTYAYSFFLVWVFRNDSSKCDLIFKELKGSLGCIDSLYDKLNVGLNIVPIISEVRKDLAENLFDSINDFKYKTALSDERLKDIFVETCQLLIRMVPDLLKSEDYREKINNIIKAVLSIPSTLDKCLLLSNLGLRCSIAGDKELFQDIVHICLEFLDKCEDIITANNIFYEISPLLFEYERELLFDKLKDVPLDFRDSVVFQVVKYILSKRPPEDPVDLKTIQRKIDFPEALKVCELLEFVSNDINIYTIISCLVDLLIEPYSKNKIKCIFPDKQILKIADKLIKIVNEKLPDKRNIKHNGYKILALACINKLRESTSYRANSRWNGILPSEEALRAQTLDLQNISDKTYVLSEMARKIYQYNSGLAMSYLQDAEESLNEISNYVDRAERYQVVAEAYKEASNTRAAKHLIEQAMVNAELCSYDQGRDQIIGGVVELAHSIDDNLASNLAAKFDQSPTNTNVNFKNTILALTLHADPQKIDTLKLQHSDSIYHDVFERVLKTLFTGRGIIQHDLVIGKWIKATQGLDYNTIYLGASWFVENFIAGRNMTTKSSSELNVLYSGILQILSMIQKVDEFLLKNSSFIDNSSSIFHILSDIEDLQTFGVGQGKEALTSVKGWLTENVKTYVKIYDPYFDESMLEIIKFVNRDARVVIMTSAKTKDIVDDELPQRFRNKWVSICDQKPPETHVHVYATPSGKTPQHDRFFISDEAGIQLGTSLNGFGKRDSTINYLDLDKKTSIESNIINSLLVMPPLVHEGEKLSIKSFTL